MRSLPHAFARTRGGSYEDVSAREGGKEKEARYFVLAGKRPSRTGAPRAGMSLLTLFEGMPVPTRAGDADEMQSAAVPREQLVDGNRFCVCLPLLSRFKNALNRPYLGLRAVLPSVSKGLRVRLSQAFAAEIHEVNGLFGAPCCRCNLLKTCG